MKLIKTDKEHDKLRKNTNKLMDIVFNGMKLD